MSHAVLKPFFELRCPKICEVNEQYRLNDTGFNMAHEIGRLHYLDT